MCAIVIRLVGVNPVKLQANVVVAEVIVPAESRVTFNVIVTVPLAVFSALVIGGTSLAAVSADVNTNVVGGPVGPAGSSSEHEALPSAHTRRSRMRLPLLRGSLDAQVTHSNR